MRPRTFVIVAGIPHEIGNEFVAGFTKTLPIVSVSWLPLERSGRYTKSYSDDLHERSAAKLRKYGSPNRHNLLADTNLILLYLDKNDGSESAIFKRFDLEALIVRMMYPGIREVPLATGNQRGRVVNELIREGRRAIGHARKLLSVVAEEVTNRDNRTCLLLPPMNFGREFRTVLDCVRDASLAGEGEKNFRKSLIGASKSLRTERKDHREYFIGQRGLVFRSPGKAGARHGMAPDWQDPDHDSSCVIRGRIRFGASFDPKFHYDCDIPKDHDRDFPGCHGRRKVPHGRAHVNIAPNDNVR